MFHLGDIVFIKEGDDKSDEEESCLRCCCSFEREEAADNEGANIFFRYWE